jgi:hypothetical protein
MQCKVYLNEARGSFFGFKTPTDRGSLADDPELIMCMKFDVPDHFANVTPYMDIDYPDGLDHVFKELNVDYPLTDWAKDYRERRLRSLSVGDVVVLGETAWAVESCGWRRITTDELQSAIIEEKEEGARL